MKYLFLFFVVLSIITCNTSKDSQGAYGAKFIFRATVEQVAAATLPEISDVSQCIIVKVNEVVVAPPGFTDWTGKSITVNVERLDRHKIGSETLFYTNGWLYGRSLAVVEAGSIDAQNISNTEILAGVQKEQDDDVKKNLKRAELVVSGKVISISEPEKQPIDSEHDPSWVTAEIEITNTFKGSFSGNTLSFQFPSSYDIMWEKAPKFKENDTGIWLLKRNQQQDEVFLVTETGDYYPANQAKYIVKLLK